MLDAPREVKLVGNAELLEQRSNLAAYCRGRRAQARRDRLIGQAIGLQRRDFHLARGQLVERGARLNTDEPVVLYALYPLLLRSSATHRTLERLGNDDCSIGEFVDHLIA